MILLTGASGFVGKRVLKKLLDAGEQVVCIARTPAKFETHKNLIVLKGDLEQSEIFSSNADTSVLKSVEKIVHLAALYDLAASAGACYMANVVATTNLLALTRKLPNFKSFIYISTVAIAGDYSGIVPTDRVELDQSFPNYYAKTKAQAEGLLRRGLDADKLCILRPGTIVGDSESGQYDKVDGPYMAMEFFKNLTNRFPFLKRLPIYPLPMNSKAQLPLVSVDIVVDVIIEVALEKNPTGCFHIVCKDAPSVLEFARAMFDELGLKGIIKPVAGAKQLSKILNKLPEIPNFPTPLIDYMSAGAVFDVTEECARFKSLENVTWAGFKATFFREALRTL